MDVVYRHHYQKKVKSFLIFFCVSLFLASCKQENTLTNINVHYEGTKGVSVHFTGSQHVDYQIVRKDKPAVAILGELNREGADISFTPAIPFEFNTSYQILEKELVVGEFTTRKKAKVKPPKLVAIHPQLDTVPENLLKMYFVFSEPMQEVASALDFIEVIDRQTTTKTNIFLPLETELWNADHTELTLWLDPGRIKKDLIPNKKLGIPIVEGNRYTIRISKQWESAEGIPLVKTYQKTIVVGPRDVQRPVVANWGLTIPSTNTKEALGISFDATLDAMLIEKNVAVLDVAGNTISGGFLVMKDGQSALFIPQETWKAGTYNLIVQSSLEDLAGNNLNRLFDTDLKQSPKTQTVASYSIVFTIP